MPKPMLKQPQTQTKTDSLLSATQQVSNTKQTTQQDKLKLEQLLRQKRSKAYMDALHRLDSGGHVHNRQQVEQIMEAIQNEFPELSLLGTLLGIVAPCYLGDDYEVHTLDITGQIVVHYQAGQKLPGGLERARVIAMQGSYDFIEVYTDCCRCISPNGVVSVVYN